MFTFRADREAGGRLARRIRRLLRDRAAMHIDELRMRLGADETAVQAQLEQLMDRGEVERLRPLGYAGTDGDFFRVHPPAPVEKEARDAWALVAQRDGRAQMRLAGEAMACLAA